MKVRSSSRVSLLAAALLMGFVAAPALAQVIDEDLKLLPDDGMAVDFFGHGISIDNGVVAVGATGNDESGTDFGSAYLFDASTGDEICKLHPSDGGENDNFGFSIAIAVDNDVVVVGAFGDDDNGRNSGSVDMFDASCNWIAKLLPRDGDEADNFGWSVDIDSAIEDGLVAVGAPQDDDNGPSSGSAYLFDASTGAEIRKLLPNDGAFNDSFGHSIAIDDNVVAVGAPEADPRGERSGSAYLFDARTGEQRCKLIPSDGEEGDWFGWSIAIDNGVVVVGSRFDDDRGDDSGSAYLFRVSDCAELRPKLLPEDGTEGDNFGWSVAISGNEVTVGVWRDEDNGERSGSAYVFSVSTGAQTCKLLPSDGFTLDDFGLSIGIDNGIVAVGARGDDDNGNASGSAYVFRPGDCESCTRDPEWRCDGDVDGDGQVNPVDSGIVQAHFGSQQDDALCNYDMDCDGQINPVDSGIVQSLFGTCETPRDVCP